MSRTAGGVTTTFQYIGRTLLVEKQGSVVIASYVYGNALLNRTSGSTTTVPLLDGHGSQRAVTDSTQSVTGSQTFDSFGNAVGSSGGGSGGSAYGYAATSGYRTDATSGADAGLMHVGARYYDAQVGRFLTRDTYLDQHPYLYCDHDPVNYADPSGHNGTLTWGGIGVGISGVPGGQVVGAVVLVGVGAYLVYDWWRNRPSPPVLPAKDSKKSGKERASDIPSWAKGTRPAPGQSGNDYAREQMDRRYPEGWERTGKKGAEFSKLKKFGDRGFD